MGLFDISKKFGTKLVNYAFNTKSSRETLGSDKNNYQSNPIQNSISNDDGDHWTECDDLDVKGSLVEQNLAKENLKKASPVSIKMLLLALQASYNDTKKHEYDRIKLEGDLEEFGFKLICNTGAYRLAEKKLVHNKEKSIQPLEIPLYQADVFVNEVNKTILISNPGTKLSIPGIWQNDLKDCLKIFVGKETSKMEKARELNDYLLNNLFPTDAYKGYDVIFTGHSAGASVSDVQAIDFAAKTTNQSDKKFNKFNKISSITFEHPGNKNVRLKELKKNNISVDESHVEFQVFNAGPNFINASGEFMHSLPAMPSKIVNEEDSFFTKVRKAFSCSEHKIGALLKNGTVYNDKLGITYSFDEELSNVLKQDFVYFYQGKLYSEGAFELKQFNMNQLETGKISFDKSDDLEMVVISKGKDKPIESDGFDSKSTSVGSESSSTKSDIANLSDFNDFDILGESDIVYIDGVEYSHLS